jgi:hypothetical protein
MKQLENESAPQKVDPSMLRTCAPKGDKSSRETWTPILKNTNVENSLPGDTTSEERADIYNPESKDIHPRYVPWNKGSRLDR